MRMRTIDIDVFINLSKKYFEEKEKNKKEERRKRGRPKVYPDYLIFALLLFKVSRRLSFRELEEISKKELKEKVPDFSSLFYRFKNIDEDILKDFVAYIGEKNKGVR